MKILKYISVALIAVMTVGVTSCTKKPDIDATEAKLPALQLSSLGYQQSGPFPIATAAATATTPATIATILQLNFGATTTKTAPGAFKLEIRDGATATSTIVKTVNFSSWSGSDDTKNHTISYILQPTTYSNTQVYSGIINLKLGSLGLTAGKTYTVIAYAYSADAKTVSTLTQLSFFKTI